MQSDVVMYAALAVAAIAGVLMWLASRPGNAAPAAAGKASSDLPVAGGEEFLLKFVVDSTGTRKGETVAVDGDRIIVKAPDGFASVPSARLRAEGGSLVLDGAVDWDAARRDGEAWRERSYKEITYKPEELPKDEA